MNEQIFNLQIILSILFVHFVSDFILQTQDQATNKSTSNKYLVTHVFNYSLLTSIFWIIFFKCVLAFPLVAKIPAGKINAVDVFIITFILHFLTDYFTSRLTKKLWEQERTHDFFVAIGFDQLLHFTQLFLMYYFLIK